MTNQQSHADGSLSDAELAWLERRAAGGFGMVMTCAAHVAPDGQGWPGELGLFDDRLLPGLTRLASALKRHGALAVAQTFHGGARAPSSLTGVQPVSASAFVLDTPGFERPRAATEEDLARIIEAFAAAARRAEAAGFDGVEVHGAHGYLLTQFLSTQTNLREDGWGGPLASRARLLREVVAATRAATGASFLVGARISPESLGLQQGLDIDEALQVARWLADDGIDFLDVSIWDAAKKPDKDPTGEATVIELFRRALPPATPLMVAGGLWTPRDVSLAMARGADLVALGRAAIAHPDWPRRALQPGYEPARPPFTRRELADAALSPVFVDYMTRWKGFVASDDAAP